MQKTGRGAVIPIGPIWSDVGSWDALWEMAERDPYENAVHGDVLLQDVTGAYVRSDGPTTAVIGLKDVIVVIEGGAVLVSARGHALELRKIADKIQKRQQDRSTG